MPDLVFPTLVPQQSETPETTLAKIAMSLANGLTVSGTASDIQIGAVEIKNATDDTRTKVAALTAITSADNGLPVTDPVAVAKQEQIRVLLAGTAQTVSGAVINANGTVASGAKSVTFIFDAGFVGTLAGITINAPESITFSAIGDNSTLAAISFTQSAGAGRYFKTV